MTFNWCRRIVRRLWPDFERYAGGSAAEEPYGLLAVECARRTTLAPPHSLAGTVRH